MPITRFEREHHRAVSQALDTLRNLWISLDETFMGAGCTDATLCVDMLAELEERMRAELQAEQEQQTVDRILQYGRELHGNVVPLGRAAR
jgi:hypothetical protein